MSTSMLWVVIVGAAAVTFVLRVSFVALLERTEMPPSNGRYGSFPRPCLRPS